MSWALWDKADVDAATGAPAGDPLVAAGGLGWLTRVAQEGDGEQLDIVINGVACRVKCTNSFEAVHVSSFERGAFYTFAALMGFLVMANLR